MKRPITRLFIANRSEIAVRIVKACRKLGIETVVGVSEADRHTLAAQLADRAICIGPAPAATSYLNMDAIVTAAKGTGCQAIHPGYGFPAEKAAFAKLCVEHGLIFVGPPASAISGMGDKLTARETAKKLNVPVVPGTDDVRDSDAVRRHACEIRYPFLLKASAGGGGRGMRIVRSADEIDGAFTGASAEARAAFNDPTLYMERYVERARHVEIQVLGDEHGNLIHLGERDCSVQRRHQKLIEESPSPVVDPALRARMADAALRLARHVSYVNAGTVEFILDLDSMEFYFLEMNTRIQVEHPVTEMVTGIDLVAEQIRIAGGEPLTVTQDVRLQGHSIECRINAEAPERNFMPSPGRITEWQAPSGSGIRVDTHCYSGYVVPPFYDSMLAKLIVHGEDRGAAIGRMANALDAFRIEGVHSTLPFHRAVLAHPDFRESRVTTQWTEQDFYREVAVA
ncbi:MAG: acetyl-CoA carboxylase biotin carboxylase subunit [Betaproteobacteria bacterium]|nr:acetyl-CoA carboxylase biotin carboxylase subunit [Betaproteobacteria bacterium]